MIYKELCLGVVKPESKADYLGVIASLAERGAQGVILGCTEIGLLIQDADTDVRLYDTTQIHAEQAVQYAFHARQK
ncbi:aspartate/glutamate racemase family protein [Halopseudomonas litoralis]|uniref:aspartate/glutamate racemase family protein n=1 Tax=Halopseudomonas litoralis TaxID=797277 RepID=UPI001E3143B9|nr:aspartate/glutamate racemase family protein [Halopseudomonas litoralis]